MSDIFPEQPITSLPAAVAFMGALPVPVGPVPQQLSADRLAEIRSLDLLALMDDRVAPVISGHLAVLVAEIGRLEHTVQQMVDGLNGHDCPPPGETPMEAVTRFAVRLMEADRLADELESLDLGDLDGRVSATCAEPGHPTWLRSATDGRGCPWCRIAELEGANSAAVAVSETLYRTLTDEKLAGSALYAALTQPTTPEQRQAALDRFLAVAQRSGQMHGPSAPDAVTQSFAPVAALREVLDGEHCAYVHHSYLKGHDRPETGGVQ